jgi:hypothetical protein
MLINWRIRWIRAVLISNEKFELVEQGGKKMILINSVFSSRYKGY